MTATDLPPRSAVPVEQQWDLASVYPSDSAWEADYAAVAAALPDLGRWQSRLGQSAGLLEALQARDREQTRVWRLQQYAGMQMIGDQGDPAAAARSQQATALEATLGEAVAYIEPELLALDPARLAALLAEEPRLAVYAHYLDNLRRRAAHVGPAAVERVLAAAGSITLAPYRTYNVLVNAELDLGRVPDGQGGQTALAQGNLDALLAGPDRAVRQAAWESYADAHLGIRNTLAQVLAAGIGSHAFLARGRDYPSALDAALDRTNMPRSVYTHLIAACRDALPLWRRYWEIRRRALGVSVLEGYDIHVPLVRGARRIRYADARELICSALAPLGPDYGAVLRRGLFEERWVDWARNEGKAAGASSSGAPGTHPFLYLSYDDSLLSVSTLAHELGHSVHSYFAWQAQPAVYAWYADFAGETASNMNQALLRAHLLATDSDPDFQLEVLAEAMNNFHRYLFLMPILAQFELDCYERVERGEGLSADTMSERITDLFREGYGPAVHIDAPRVGVTWAQFPHLYFGHYVHTYALGIAAANALAATVRQEGAPAAARYLGFLQASDSVYPLDALRLAGVDLTTPEPVARAFAVLETLIDRLDTLVGPGPLR
jgi:oligoendopeptidase F